MRIDAVNDDHVDNYLKEIRVFVYYGFIVNNGPKKLQPADWFINNGCFLLICRTIYYVM